MKRTLSTDISPLNNKSKSLISCVSSCLAFITVYKDYAIKSNVFLDSGWASRGVGTVTGLTSWNTKLTYDFLGPQMNQRKVVSSFSLPYPHIPNSFRENSIFLSNRERPWITLVTASSIGPLGEHAHLLFILLPVSGDNCVAGWEL